MLGWSVALRVSTPGSPTFLSHHRRPLPILPPSPSPGGRSYSLRPPPSATRTLPTVCFRSLFHSARPSLFLPLALSVSSLSLTLSLSLSSSLCHPALAAALNATSCPQPRPQPQIARAQSNRGCVTGHFAGCRSIRGEVRIRLFRTIVELRDLRTRKLRFVFSNDAYITAML